MHRGILQLGSDLGEVQIVFPDHLLALLELDTADIFAGRDLQILMEQSGQITGAHIHLPGNQRYGQFFPDVRGNILLCLADNLIFRVDGIGGLELAHFGRDRFPQQKQQEHIQLGQNDITGAWSAERSQPAGVP